MSVLDSIIKDLHELPPTRLEEVARYVHNLVPKVRSAEEHRAAIMALAGCMADAEGEEFERAVLAEGNRIDADTH